MLATLLDQWDIAAVIVDMSSGSKAIAEYIDGMYAHTKTHVFMYCVVFSIHCDLFVEFLLH